MKSQQLLQTLSTQTEQLLLRATQLKNLEEETMRRRPSETEWNILECLEHLNLYGDYYIPEIHAAIHKAPNPSEDEFKTGFLGNYFAKSMLPKEKLNKMNTFKNKNPLHASLNRAAIDRFVAQQNELLRLLNEAALVSLNHTKIKTSLSPLLRLNLGDTFRFYINHMIRHFAQIERILTRP